MANKQTKTGRSKTERFVGLPYYLVMKPEICSAYRALSSNARSALIQVTARYHGSNNGYLNASVRDIGAEMNVSKSTASRALTELIERGFLEVTEWSTFNLKTRLAKSYRLTWRRCDRANQPPSKAFLNPHGASQSHEKSLHSPTGDAHGLTGEAVGAKQTPKTR